MQIYDRDAYDMIGRFIDHARPVTVLDVGANVGQSAERILMNFPKATVHAFEPAPAAFSQLAARVARDLRIVPWPLAVGASAGRVKLNLMNDSLMSSVLTRGQLGAAYFPDEVIERTVEVPRVSLDQWAAENDIGPIDFMKIDVQGIELDAPRGAERLLRTGGVLAVKCEAQVIQEYQGACTFFEIEPFMRSVGLRLHQIHDVWERGEDRQTTCLDALWVRPEVLDWLRQEPLFAYRIDWRRRMTEALVACRAGGKRRIALYGAGQHTRGCEPVLRAAPEVVAIIDDSPAAHGSTLLDRPVISTAEALARGIDAVVLSSNSHEQLLWDKSSTIRGAGIPVFRLYPENSEAHPHRSTTPRPVAIAG